MIDPNAIADLCTAVKDGPDELWKPMRFSYTRLNNSQKRIMWTVTNCSTNPPQTNLIHRWLLSSRLFLDKIVDGTLEIRLTAPPITQKRIFYQYV